MLEGLGFCEKGEGGQLAASGELKLGGRLPMNTDGGGLSACHSGPNGKLYKRQLREPYWQGHEKMI